MSVWNSYLRLQFDALVVGGGFTGLNTALLLKEINPKWKIAVLEALPFGALGSTNNAGFACFGSASEIHSDIQKVPRNQMIELIRKRFQGIQRLSSLTDIDAEFYGGYDVFLSEDLDVFEAVSENLSEINDLVFEATQIRQMFNEVDLRDLKFGFSSKGFKNESEFQLNPGKLHRKLSELCIVKGIQLINGVELVGYESGDDGCFVETSTGDFSAKQLILCTNGLTQKVVKKAKVKPARGQVLFAKVEGGFEPKGNFHATEGFYYFRNFQDGILLGGGRQLNIVGETSDLPVITDEIQDHLTDYLATYILPNQEFKVENRWAGIMGMGDQKFPIVEKFEEHVYGAFAFGGMGVALSYTIAQDLVKLISKDAQPA